MPTRRRPPVYTDLTKRYAKFLFPLIDPYDWGEKSWTGEVHRANTNDRLNLLYGGGLREAGVHLDRLTKTKLQKHLALDAQLLSTSCRGSGFAFIMLDVNAHEGQTDAGAAARFLVDTFFPRAYDEPSARGWHVYVVFRVGRVRRAEFNVRMRGLERDLAAVLAAEGFASMLEITGGFTEVVHVGPGQREVATRAQMAAVPFLPNGVTDLERLVQAPVFLPDVLLGQVNYHLDQLAILARLEGDNRHTVIPNVYVPTEGRPHAHQAGPVNRARRFQPDSPNAFHRMMWACAEYAIRYGAMPDEGELLEFYARELGKGPATARRAKRAGDVIKLMDRSFSQDKVGAAGYAAQRDRLLDAVRSYCPDRENRYGEVVTDEDLAVALHVVTRNSFRRYDTPARQWSCSGEAFNVMFRALREEGVIDRPIPRRNKVVVMKEMLERAGLIETVDPRWRWGASGRGVGKKYVVGPAHWRREEFLGFSADVLVQLVGSLAAKPLRAKVAA